MQPNLVCAGTIMQIVQDSQVFFAHASHTIVYAYIARASQRALSLSFPSALVWKLDARARNCLGRPPTPWARPNWKGPWCCAV